MEQKFTHREFLEKLDICYNDMERINAFSQYGNWRRYKERFIPFIEDGIRQIKALAKKLVEDGAINLDDTYSMVPYLRVHTLRKGGILLVINQGTQESLEERFLFKSDLSNPY